MKPRLLISLLFTAVLHAQQPAPPPPPEPGGGGNNGIPGGNLDLSNIPVPEADKKKLPELSEAELKAKPVQLSVVPIGWVTKSRQMPGSTRSRKVRSVGSGSSSVGATTWARSATSA